MQLPESSKALLEQANNELLLKQIIVQLNKDFHLANIDHDFDLTLSPSALTEDLYQKIHQLINHRYDDYLNLLYRIDVAERELSEIKGELQDGLEQVTLLILKRIYKKVWFRNRL